MSVIIATVARLQVQNALLAMPRESYRSFAKDIEDLAATWATNVTTQDEWQDLGQFGGSESKPFRVQSGQFIGLAKPGEKKGDAIGRAAHEKIASDLAYLLRLPLPPVILWDRGPTPKERFVSISAWAFSPALSWGEAANLLSEKHKSEASEVMSGVLAFEAWISAQDRKGDHVLVNVVKADDSLQLAFIDYAYSLSMSWAGPNATVAAPSLAVPVPRNEGAIRSVTESILHVGDETITQLVSRVPDDYLPLDKGKIIISNLLSRRDNLRAILGLN
jgi:hypothetical protein